ncbi:hypothetical protein ABVT39_009438 [Epinephelus coioides]
MTSLCMTASFRCSSRSRYNPTRTRKIKLIRPDRHLWMFEGSPETVRVPDPLSPHRQRLHQLRMEGEAVSPRAAFITRQRGNVDRNQRSPMLETMSHSAALPSPVCKSGLRL